MITILLFSLAMIGLGVATITASKSSVLERKILELEKELNEFRSEVEGKNKRD